MKTRLAATSVPALIWLYIFLLSFSLATILTGEVTRTRFHFKSLFKTKPSPSATGAFPFETFSVHQVHSGNPPDPQFAPKLHAFLNITITQYITWHQQQRHLCEVDPAYARSIPILVSRNNGYAGVGDRIRGILYSYLIAVASKRLFLIDWQEPIPIANALPSPPQHNFTYDRALFTSGEHEELVIDGPARYRKLDVYFSSSRVLVNRKPNPFDFKRFFALYDRYPDLDLSSKVTEAGLKDFRPVREEVAPFILKALFKTSPSVRSSLQKLRPFSYGKPFISLHARLGHGVGEEWGRFNFENKGLDLRSASMCIGSLAASMAQQRGLDRVFVATDTERAREWLEAGVHSVLPKAQVAQSSINATHIKALHQNKRSSEASTRLRKFEEVFLDLGLLAMAESMVFFRSGFAQVAVWFGAMTDSVLVDVDDCAQMVRSSENGTELLDWNYSRAFKELVGGYLQVEKAGR
ncbi:hypothetical protein FGB62_17g13 [Gracilaria domingensis]|nr:hypothetical protein FGB62_17g13 [Gracilaria domingensis]